MPLYTGVRRRVILGRPFAAYCIPSTPRHIGPAITKPCTGIRDPHVVAPHKDAPTRIEIRAAEEMM